MIVIAVAVALLLFIAGLSAFDRSRVRSVKAFLSWIAALGACSLALMLALTGRFILAVAVLVLLAPVILGAFGPPRLIAGLSRKRSPPSGRGGLGSPGTHPFRRRPR